MSRSPARLRVDGRDTASRGSDRHVLVATDRRPRLSWIVPLDHEGHQQVSYEVRLPRGEVVRGSGADPWMSVPTPVAADSVYTWAVRVLDERGDWSPWAESAFETGPFDLSDWGAEWVAAGSGTTISHQVDVAGAPARARLHLTAQGLVRATVNGVPVNADSSDPSRTDVVRALYRTYDVTNLLHAGSNTVELTLAHGEWHRTGLDPRVLAELVVDGRVLLGTGAGWNATSSAVVVENPFYLERHDTTAAPTARTSIVLAAETLTADQAMPPTSVLPDPSPPLRVVDRVAVVPLVTQGNERVFAVASNVAGRSRVTITGGVARGTVVSIIHGEHLSADGRVDTTNLTMPYDHGRERQVIEHVATGEPGQVLESWFSYHGFAYLEVRGLTTEALIEVTVRTLHTDLTPTSTLATDSSVITALKNAAGRTLLNNVHGIPEDCPTREQSGWTGDTASVADYEFAAFDMQTFFDKWLGDLRTSQADDGAIPAVAPDIRTEPLPSDPVWGAAVHRVLHGHWNSYGDRRVIETNLPMLRAWVAFQLSCIDGDGVIGRAPISYGHDWLALQQTPPRLLHTAAVIESLESLIALEDVVGTDSTPLAAQLAALRSAAALRFVDPVTGGVGNGSQGSLAMAARAGFAGESPANSIADAIAADVRLRGNRVSSGFAATRAVVEALAHAGHSQVVFDALHQSVEPGVGAMIDHGPGTFWENWWIDPKNTGTGSLDHVGLGGPFAAWAERDLAGIRPISSGFSRMLFRPRFVDGVSRLDYTLDTVRGEVAAHFVRSGNTVTVRLTVPVGSSADVELPGIATAVGSGHHEFVVPWTASQRIDAVQGEAWRAPSLQPRASDVSSGSDWNLAAYGATAETLECMPVPHAQIAGPLLRVAGLTPTALLPFEVPVDAHGGTFIYAHVDTCTGSPVAASEVTMTVLADDGTSVTASERLWPAGWNRIAVDISGWSGRRAISAVEVAVSYPGANDPCLFHLGSVGVSGRRRTS